MAEVAERIEIRPQPGPQTVAASSPADIVIYGGAAGAGKSWWLVYEAARAAHVPKYRGVLFRRTYPELTGGGGVWEEAQGLYRRMGGEPRAQPNLDMTWRHRAGEARVEFRHLQREHDVHSHQSRQYAFIGFDEVQQFSEAQFFYMLSRLRTTCGVKPYVRASCNPDPDSFVRTLIDWWIGDDGLPIPERSGVLRWFARVGDDLVWGDSREHVEAQAPGALPMSLTFVAAKLEDNQALLRQDPEYRARLQQLPRVQRERLEGGNWDVRPAAGNYFRRGWFRVVESVDELPSPPVAMVRAWDKAATEPSESYPDPDWTRGALVARLRDGDFAILHMEGERTTPGRVESLITNTASADGPKVKVAVWEDPGAAGKADADRMRRLLTGHRVQTVKAALNKQQYAEVWSPLVENGRVHVVRGPWTEAFFREAESFPDGAHDDAIDAVSLAFQLLTGNASRLKAAMEQVR